MESDIQELLEKLQRLTKEIVHNAERPSVVYEKSKQLWKLIRSVLPKTHENFSGEHINIIATLEDPELSSSKLMSLAQSPRESRKPWYVAPEIPCKLADLLLDRGEPMLAYDVVTYAKIDGDLHDHARILQLEALALIRCGSIDQAIHLLEKLLDSNPQDEETLVLLAGAHRDLAIESTGEEQEKHFNKSYRLYDKVYTINHKAWVCDRAAIMAFLTKNGKRAQTLATQAKEQSLKELDQLANEKNDPKRFWPLIVLGNSSLILGRKTEAESYYADAAQFAKGQYGRLASATKHVRLLAEFLNLDWPKLRLAFGIPNIVVFAGHMIDRSDWKDPPRFPETLFIPIKLEIKNRLEKLGGKIGYASASCGSDLLFHQVIKDLGGESHVVLPCNQKEFLARSVSPGGPQWVSRFEALVKSSKPMIANEQLTDGGAGFEYSNRILHGLAAMQARQLDTDLKFLAVWDGKLGKGPGGTADHVRRWQALGHDVEIINPNHFHEQLSLEINGFDSRVSIKKIVPKQPPKTDYPTRLAALYFADVVNFSKLKEEEVPRFVDKFLGLAANLLKPFETSGAVLKKNTWGDGIYIAFTDPKNAGLYALELRDKIANTKWAVHGLPSDLNLRASLHAGPVFQGIDPMTGEKNCMGSHVSKTARIEPITPPGQIYASQEFAALAITDGIKEFEMDYVGLKEYAKNFGIFPTYHVRRKR